MNKGDKMKGKIFWFDVETTGLSASDNCLIQLAAVIEINGRVEDEIDILVSPPPNTIIEDDALKVHGRTKNEILEFQSPSSAHNELLYHLVPFIDKYDKRDKFVPAGYFVNFDVQFLRSHFNNVNDKYFGSWFTSVSLDVSSFVAESVIKLGTILPQDFKLSTICKHHNIKDFKAHDALADIKATRELYYTLTGA